MKPNPENGVSEEGDLEIEEEEWEQQRNETPDLPLLPVQLPSQNFASFWSYMKTVSILFHLATFAIFGVIIRFSLKVLFGPDIVGATSDTSFIYLDLPSNMIGSFFMGWVGVVFKKNISIYSEPLSIGLSTGLMGSITTFSAWMQSVSNLTTQGHWIIGMICVLLGMELAQISLFMGIEFAQGLVSLSRHLTNSNIGYVPIKSCKSKLYSIIFIFLYSFLWGASISLSTLEFEFKHRQKLGLACMIGPIGAWMRWYLSHLNGKGIFIKGKNHLKWCPFGTLLANLVATSIMACLSIMKQKVNDESEILVIDAITLGFLGCLSTVSTFVVEVRALYQSKHPWRAYLYILMTIFPSLVLQTVLYSFPIWIKSYPLLFSFSYL